MKLNTYHSKKQNTDQNLNLNRLYTKIKSEISESDNIFSLKSIICCLPLLKNMKNLNIENLLYAILKKLSFFLKKEDFWENSVFLLNLYSVLSDILYEFVNDYSNNEIHDLFNSVLLKINTLLDNNFNLLNDAREINMKSSSNVTSSTMNDPAGLYIRKTVNKSGIKNNIKNENFDIKGNSNKIENKKNLKENIDNNLYTNNDNNQVNKSSKSKPKQNRHIINEKKKQKVEKNEDFHKQIKPEDNLKIDKKINESSSLSLIKPIEEIIYNIINQMKEEFTQKTSQEVDFIKICNTSKEYLYLLTAKELKGKLINIRGILDLFYEYRDMSIKTSSSINSNSYLDILSNISSPMKIMKEGVDMIIINKQDNQDYKVKIMLFSKKFLIVKSLLEKYSHILDYINSTEHKKTNSKYDSASLFNRICMYYHSLSYKIFKNDIEKANFIKKKSKIVYVEEIDNENIVKSTSVLKYIQKKVVFNEEFFNVKNENVDFNEINLKDVKFLFNENTCLFYLVDC